MQQSLFPLSAAESLPDPFLGSGQPRILRPQRQQIEWTLVDLDRWLPSDHPARLVWTWVQEFDLAPLYAHIQAVEGEAGRPAIDPALLVAVWLLATLEGVGSARQLARLCQEHLAYRWLCGGVSLNDHTLADFRVQQVAFLNQLLVDSLAAWQMEGWVDVQEVAQDGKKIRASAGSASFHRRDTLEKHLEQARQRVEQLSQAVDTDLQARSTRQQKAQERAARERLARLQKAKQELEAIEQRAKETGRAAKDKQAGKEYRASETDPEARVMKMADGGYRPAYNAQFCTDTSSNLILGVQVSQQGNDTGLASPMLQQIETDLGQRPAVILADSSYFSLKAVDQVVDQDCQPYVSLPRKGGQPAGEEAPHYLPKKGDSPAVAALRQRMGTAEAQEKMKTRGAVAELVHAVLDQWNLARVRVRGIEKVRTVLVWFVLVHNWIRVRLLRRRQAAAAAG